MPSDIVSVAVSTGLGVSVLAGIVSGVCYVLANRIRAKRKRKPGREWYCDVCGTYLRSIRGILEGDKVVTCSKCLRRVCRGTCSALSEESGWMCRNCLDTSESWIQGILNVLPFVTTVDEDYRMNLDPPEEPKKVLKEQVRDFIEKLVASMLGENVDDASVSKMYNEEQYDSILRRYHGDLSNVLTDLGSALHMNMSNLPPSGQSSPSAAHVVLKNLIERLLQECATLPELRRLRDHPAQPADPTERTYEDLLATAIINKVISSTQNRPTSSSPASVSSRTSKSHDKEYFFGEETLDSKWKNNDAESTSVSSLEDWLYSDSSFGSKKVVDKETFTIKQLIEEVSQSEDSEDEEVEEREYNLRSKLSVYDEDEPNWFLQKRQFRGTNSPVPVPMLVPKPTTEAKVLIGDKEVEETSDLSDVASDFGDADDDVQPTTRQALLVESKRLIGGKNRGFHGSSDGESSADSGVKELRDKSGYDDPIEEEVMKVKMEEKEEFVVKADITVDDDNVEDASILSVYSNTEKEAEYTEKYASLPRTVIKSPTPPIRQSIHKSAKAPEKKLPVIKNETTDEEDDAPDGIFKFSGCYSKREKEKWKHAIEMKNNPYSKENIEKRIKRSRSAASSIFGPDYYARLASTPSGGKLRSPEAREVAWPPPKEENDLDNLTNGNNEEDEVFENNVTSDSDLSYVNFYDVENSQVYKKTKEELAEENPEYDERPRYVKSTSVAQTARIVPKNLRRHRSESDLLEESFDAPPKVLGRKRDNTLISKIYSQPHVRNFALNSRKQVPQTPTFNSYSYSDTERYNGKTAMYSSDDGHSPKSIYIDQQVEPSRPARNHSLSSEEDILSETSKISSRHLIYSSSEDLLSIEEHERPQPKKDNTLIEKIYRNANVRNFAMSRSLSNVPIPEPRRKIPEDEPKPSPPEPSFQPEIIITPYTPPEKKEEIQQESNGVDDREEEVVSPDPEIGEIAKRKIVHQVLEQISEKPKVATRTKAHIKVEINNNHNYDDEEITISVKELRKMFETNETKNLVHSSLTGRSLSKQLKETLKN